jgi:hypothetical protein
VAGLLQEEAGEQPPRADAERNVGALLRATRDFVIAGEMNPTAAEIAAKGQAGGSAQLRWTDGFNVNMRVERVEEPTVFAFTWQIFGLPEDDVRRTYVEFTLDPVDTDTRSPFSRVRIWR